MRVRRLREDAIVDASESGIATLSSNLPKPPIVRHRPMILRIGTPQKAVIIISPILTCLFASPVPAPLLLPERYSVHFRRVHRHARRPHRLGKFIRSLSSLEHSETDRHARRTRICAS